MTGVPSLACRTNNLTPIHVQFANRKDYVLQNELLEAIEFYYREGPSTGGFRVLIRGQFVTH